MSRRPGDGPPHEPWVESRAGGLFFLNALLAAPALVVAFPLVLGALLRRAGLVGPGFSPVLDPIPGAAAHVLPWVGWLAAVPLVLAARNLALTGLRWARGALLVFMAAHGVVLAWTASSWMGW